MQDQSKTAEPAGVREPAAKVEAAPKGKWSLLEAITKRGKLWQLSPNPDLKGMRGRLAIKFPEGTSTNARVVRVYEPGAQKVDIQDAWGKPMELLGGEYDIVLNGARVAKVSIKKGNDTRLLVGAVRLNAKFGTRVVILDENKKQVFATATGPTVVALPVGKYFGGIGKKTVELDVRDGQITDF